MANIRRAVISVALACLLGPVCLSAQSTGKTVRHHRVAEQENSFPPELVQAESAIEKKDYAAAVPLLQKVVTADPANYQAWFDLGFVQNALGNPDESISAYRKSVAAKPDIFESNLNLGLMLAKISQPDAEQFLRAATKLKPTAQVEEGQERAWLSLAHVLEGPKPDEALAAYKQAASLQPKDIEPHLSAGQLFEKSGRDTEAEQEYKQALIIDPTSADAITGIANTAMRGKRFGEAEDALRKLLAQHPEDAAAHLQLGRMLAAAGKNDDAVVELKAAQKLAPNDPATQRDIADLSLAAGKLNEAETQYRALLTAAPRDADLHSVLGKVLLKEKKFPEAQQHLLAAVQLKPDFGAAYGDLAVAASENQNYELAIKAVDARAKFLPEIPVGYFLRATAYDHLRNYKLAAENYHHFLEVADGKFPDQEWQARHRLIAIEPKK